MRRVGWLVPVAVLVIGACRPPAPAPAPAPPDSPFGALRRVLIDGATTPGEPVRLRATVLNTGASRDGTWLELSDVDTPGDRVIVVYGTTADAALAAPLLGRRIQARFVPLAPTTLTDGRAAVRVRLVGIRAEPAPQAPP